MAIRKLAVIGLDGATFDLILPWAKSGKLPHIRKLLESGVYGELISTIPPITGAAWSSFQTGVNPGRHGIFDWLTRIPQSYRLMAINSSLIKRRTLWEFISMHGGKVGVIGVPVTYPHRRVNGFLLSDLLTPEGANYAFPEELQLELEAKVGHYSVMPEHWRGRYEVEEWLKGLQHSLLSRKEAALYLIKQYAWDFFMVHFMETDSVQHQMWHTIDGVARPKYKVRINSLKIKKNPILEIYQLADQAVGEIVHSLPSGTTIFLISDHGFGPLYYNVYLNNWLLQEGYLQLKKNIGTFLKYLAFKLGITPENLFPLAERFGILKKGTKLKHGQIHDLLGKIFLSTQNIDWGKTRAYSYGNIGQIYLNLQGREPCGIVPRAEAIKLVEEMIAKLERFKNPFNGEPAFAKIYRKEEIYQGEELERAPEILVIPQDGSMTVGTSEFVSNKIMAHTFGGSGWHRLEGIFLAAGENVKQGKVLGLRLVDLFPTILYALGLPIPQGLDGKVLEEIFRADFLASNPKIFTEEEFQPKDINYTKPDAEEQREIRERLKGLGYV